MVKNRTIFIRTDNPQFHATVCQLMADSWGWDVAYIKSFMCDEKSESLDKPDKISRFNQFVNGLVPGLIVCLENNYVDKVYRDSYYSYYASKAAEISRNCIKISFFINPDDEILEDREVKYEEKEILERNYRGFVVLRPTVPNILGRSAISPEIVVRKKGW